MSDYSFTSTAGTDNSRFSITAQRVPTGNLVETEADEPSISIVNCKLSIVYMLPLTSVRIFDALGRLVANKTLINNLLEINLSTKGIYLVQIETGEKSWVKKVVY
jgi:hypothetical protein